MKSVKIHPPCSVDGCANGGRRAQGMCMTHYLRAYRRKLIPNSAPPKKRDGEDFLALAIEVGRARTSRQSRGYAVIHGQGSAELVSRLVCEAVHGPAPEGKPLALHNCDNGHEGCIEATHIGWGSYRQNNVDDRIRAGTFSPWRKRA